MKTISTTVQVTLTPKEVAGLFCEMDNTEQAEFFNAVAHEVAQWDGSFEVQMLDVVSTGMLWPDAIDIMKTIGESIKK